MNRERAAWTIGIILLAILAFNLPGTLAQRDDDYAWVRTLVDIHRRVATDYVEAVDDARLRQGAIDGMLEQLDPYSVYVPPAERENFDRMLEGSFKGVGITLNQKENGQIEVVSPIDDSPAFKAGVQAGDIILKVNGESLEGMKLAEVVRKIGGKLGSEVILSVRHATGETADLAMTRQEIVVPVIKGYGRNEDLSWNWWVSRDPKIAYVRITQFTPDVFEKLRDILRKDQNSGLLAQGMQGLILDLRFNPGGRLDEAVRIVDLFVESGKIVTTRGRNRPEDVKMAEGPGTLPPFPMIVLVNEHSASASEIVAGSLMDNKRALVIGQRTYGKGSVQELIDLDNKSGELKLTVAYYYLPSGRLVHRKKDAKEWGVEPQIIVPMDDAAERRMMQDRTEAELLRKPALRNGATRPSTQPVDPQLQQAVNTMVGLIVLQPAEAPVPPTLPAQSATHPMTTTAPASQP